MVVLVDFVEVGVDGEVLLVFGVFVCEVLFEGGVLGY